MLLDKFFNANDFLQRRLKVASQMQPNSIAIIPSQKQTYRNADTEARFRQNSDFYYLTGIKYPEVLFVLTKDKNEEINYFLFLTPLTKDQEVWVGSKINLKDAKDVYGANESFHYSELENILPKLIKEKETLYYIPGIDFDIDTRINKILDSGIVFAPSNKHKQILSAVYNQNGKHSLKQVIDFREVVHEIRIQKTDSEVKLMKQVIKSSAFAHNELMRSCKPGLSESQIEAMFAFYTKMHGCETLSYPAIVASGNNACVLHYIDNSCELKSGDLLLVDAGAELSYYAADITRTFPVNGKFTGEQKEIYNLVLESQKAGLSVVKSGIKFIEIQEKIVEVLATGLSDLKIINATKDEIIEENLYKDFYMHLSGHWLGLDVHDALYTRTDSQHIVKENSILTVEPGIYINKDNKNVAEKWRGIGVRIEDDILVTNSGSENLSIDAVKEVTDIENLMAERQEIEQAFGVN